MYVNHPAADTYLTLPGHYISWFILLVGLSLFFFLLLKRMNLLRQGKPDPRFSDVKTRMAALVKDGVFQRRQTRYPFAGVIHITIFWGFILLALHSIDLIAGGLRPGYVPGILAGRFGAFYSSLKDIVAVIVLVACGAAIYRRAVVKPERYRGSSRFEAFLVLGLIGFLMITDILYEGSRSGFEHNGPVLVAAKTAETALSGLSPESLKTVNHLSYWLHLVGFFFFLNLLPLSKHFHIITALPNVFFKKLDRGAVKPPQWDIDEFEGLDSAGVHTFDDFTWKHILDFFACTECGRCSEHCPANAVGKPLSPKHFTMRLRDFGYRNSPFSLHRNFRYRALPGEVVDDDIFWSCTTCGACEAECPVFVEYIDKMVDFRRRRVMMESNFPVEVERIYRKIETYGDAWGMGPALRSDWAKGLSAKTVQDDADMDILFWVGCAGAFDSRSQQVATAFAKILTAAGIHFRILGIEENCCGDYARRTGNDYLFDVLAKKNMETFRKYDIRKIVALCPHGYNTLKNEYPRFGADFQVFHALEYVHLLLKERRISPAPGSRQTVVYHDPCYLGRHNGIYEIPRNILSRMPGLSIVEPEKSRDRSFCCGAGGGQFWMESTGPRMNDVRLNQLLEKEPELIATSCPYCLIMLEDGIETKGLQGRIPVQDVIEIVAERMQV
ncbi:MAG: (Fe-S)-binding protein [Desulfobacterales bacterium]